jgi:hypothetical protein
MTIYLWHMSVLVTIALIILAAGLPFPTPLSLAWWVTRGYWLLAIGLGMIIAARALGRFERGRPRGERRPARSTGSLPIMVGAVLLAIVAVGVVLVAGFSVLSATLATLGLAVALRLTGGTRGRMITAAA